MKLFEILEGTKTQFSFYFDFLLSRVGQQLISIDWTRRKELLCFRYRNVDCRHQTRILRLLLIMKGFPLSKKVELKYINTPIFFAWEDYCN